MTQAPVPAATSRPTRRPTPWSTVGLAVLLPVAVLALAGVGGGALWAWWADPPAQSELTQQNYNVLIGQLFGVELRYAAVALVLGLLAGVVLAVPLRHLGWPLVVGAALGGLAAAAVSYWLGVWWGPSPAPGLSRDRDLFSGALVLTTRGLYLAWPVAAVAGCWLVAWALDRDPVPPGADLPELERPDRTNG